MNTQRADEFNGKRVLVTGGTKGAGKAIADRFQEGGATVIITARSAPTEKTDNHFIQADVSTPEGTTEVIHEILNLPGERGLRHTQALRGSMVMLLLSNGHEISQMS